MKLSSFVVVISAVALTSLTAACSSEPPQKEDTESVRAAICGGGGGGGDSCSSAYGYCPPECSYCFQSAAHRIELQNKWECDGDPGGGGGGGGGSCSQDQSYISRKLDLADPGDDHETILNVLCRDAKSEAESACRNSGRVCTAHLGSGSQGSRGCTSDGFCECDYTANCTYTWF